MVIFPRGSDRDRRGPGEDSARQGMRRVEAYGVKYDRAVKCLTKDRADLLAFHDCPANAGPPACRLRPDAGLHESVRRGLRGPTGATAPSSSVYLLVLIRNLLMHLAEKILLMQPLLSGGLPRHESSGAGLSMGCRYASRIRVPQITKKSALVTASPELRTANCTRAPTPVPSASKYRLPVPVS